MKLLLTSNTLWNKTSLTPGSKALRWQYWHWTVYKTSECDVVVNMNDSLVVGSTVTSVTVKSTRYRYRQNQASATPQNRPFGELGRVIRTQYGLATGDESSFTRYWYCCCCRQCDSLNIYINRTTWSSRFLSASRTGWWEGWWRVVSNGEHSIWLWTKKLLIQSGRKGWQHRMPLTSLKSVGSDVCVPFVSLTGVNWSRDIRLKPFTTSRQSGKRRLLLTL